MASEGGVGDRINDEKVNSVGTTIPLLGDERLSVTIRKILEME